MQQSFPMPGIMELLIVGLVLLALVGIPALIVAVVVTSNRRRRDEEK